MKLPKRIKICHQTWRIEPVRLLFEGDDLLNGEPMYGRTIRAKTLIQIATHPSKGQRRDTLLHEILHAIIGNTTLKGDEEKLVRQVTPYLLGALRDNPDLVAYLTEPDPT